MKKWALTLAGLAVANIASAQASTNLKIVSTKQVAEMLVQAEVPNGESYMSGGYQRAFGLMPVVTDALGQGALESWWLNTFLGAGAINNLRPGDYLLGSVSSQPDNNYTPIRIAPVQSDGTSAYYMAVAIKNPSYVMNQVQVEMDGATCIQLGAALNNNASSLGYQMLFIDASACTTDSAGNSTTTAYVVVNR